MNKLNFILLFFLITLTVFSQNDSLKKAYEENSAKIDSLNLRVNNIIVTGNRITKEDIILREMTLKKGSRFRLKKYTADIMKIYNLALFTKVDIYPIPQPGRDITLNVDVKERWYILPLPNAGIENGQWRQFWLSLNLRWDNFRGRNERLNIAGKFFYNPSFNFSYYIPWIGKELHLFTGISGGWQSNWNRSLSAVGKTGEYGALTYGDVNFQNIQYTARLTVGKYFGKFFSVFTNYGYNFLRVTQYAPGRTVSDDGVDRYLTFGLGVTYDTRDINEYATKGIYFKTDYQRSGFIDSEVNFGRYSLENESYIPVNITKSYYFTVASRVYTSIGMGPVIPLYDNQFLGYGDNYVRGWNRYTFEGDNVMTIYNEIRIPVIKPRYVRGKDLIVAKSLPIVKDLDLRHGLYFTLIYDIGTVWYEDQNIFKKRFISGAGLGINIIAPFGYVLRADWVFRLADPVVGQIGFNFYAKF